LPSDWANYINLVVYKDGEVVTNTVNGTRAVDAGTYRLEFTFKDEVKNAKGASNIYFVTKNGTQYPSATVTCTVKKLEIVVAGWSSKPPIPTFTSDDVSYDFYEVVYLDKNENIITKDEILSGKYNETKCYAYVKPVFGMEDNVNISTVDGSTLYEWYMTFNDSATEKVAPALRQTEFAYNGKAVNIVKYLNDNYDSATMVVSGDLGKTNVGSYKIYISLDGTQNVVWADDYEGIVVLEFNINKASVTVTWDKNGSTPVIKSDLPDDAIEYEYYKDGVKVDKDSLQDGESYEVRAKISDEYSDNYDFEGLSDNEAVTTFSYVDTSSTGGNGGNGNGNGDGNGGSGNGGSGNGDGNGTSNANENGNGSGSGNGNGTNGGDDSNNVVDNNGNNNGGSDSADIGNGDIGSSGTTDISTSEDLPLWQIIVGSISFVVGFIAYVQAGINNRAARRMNRRTNHMKCSTVGVGLALLALFGIENVGWTVIAIVLLALCILGIGAWIVSKIKRAVAEDRMGMTAVMMVALIMAVAE
jgi:hypothetical protein